MKTPENKLHLMSGLMALIVMLFACEKDEMQTPVPSTQADFTYEALMIEDDNAPLGLRFKVDFTNKSVNALSYHWDFGNGETSTEENPTTYYDQSGQFTVRLTVASAEELYYNNLEKGVTLTFILDAVSLPYSEDFKGGIANDIDDTWLPDGWKSVDADGDGFNWYFAPGLDEGHMRSQSWDPDEGALTPDNYLITPKIDLTEIADDTKVMLNFQITMTANTPQYRKEHYGVFVSTSDNEAEDFTHLVFEETFTEDMENWEFYLREVDLSSFKGEYIYIAFRHFNITDMDRIVIDEVQVFEE